MACFTFDFSSFDIKYIARWHIYFWEIHPSVHSFSCVSSRRRAAPLGSDPQCVPSRKSSRPQETLDPPACTTGRRKGVWEKAWTNDVFRFLTSQIDESSRLFCVTVRCTKFLKGCSVNHIWLKAGSALRSVGLKSWPYTDSDATTGIKPFTADGNISVRALARGAIWQKQTNDNLNKLKLLADLSLTGESDSLN